MIHKYFLYVLLIVSSCLYGQSKGIASESISITGLVDSTIVFTYQDIAKEKIYDIGDLSITNHLGEFKKSYKNLRGNTR
jgi:hypothetical protein